MTVHSNKTSTIIRLFGWSMLALMIAFLINNFLSNGAGLPGASLDFARQHGFFSWSALQTMLYPLLLGVAGAYVFACSKTSLRTESATVSSINTFFIRAAFWCVLLIGVVDTTISFLRIEEFI